MTDRFTKVFESMLDSTIWFEDSDVRCVWITMLALADADGIVENTVPGLAKRALPRDPLQVAIDKTEEALERFRQPDQYSRTKDHEGRRIEDVDGGWLLLNHAKYREKRQKETRREQNREAQQRSRQRKAKKNADSQHRSAESAQAEAEEEAERESAREAPSPPPPDDSDAPPGLSPSARAKPGWVLLWQLWDQELNAGKGGDMRSHEERLSAAWRACSAHNPDDPLGAFRAAGKAFIRHREESGKKLGLAVLCSQLDVWLESEPPPRTEADRQADLDRTMAENDALVANQKVVTR